MWDVVKYYNTTKACCSYGVGQTWRMNQSSSKVNNQYLDLVYLNTIHQAIE